MRNMWKKVDAMKPTMLMAMAQFAYTGSNVVYKLAVMDGMNMPVAIAYRYIFASIFTIPVALLFESKKSRSKLTWRILFVGFVSGIFGGSLYQNLYMGSLALTSATFISAVFNLTPAITFVLAIFFRLEKLRWGTAAGKAKVVGTVIGIGGAMVMSFVKGIEIKFWNFHITLIHQRQHKNGHVASHNAEFHRQVLGILCALGSCLSYSLWLIMQGRMSIDTEKYAGFLSSTALMCAMAAIQSTIFALCVERDWSQWKLGWNIRLLTVAYSGIVPSGIMVMCIAYCVEKRGPLFASIFGPLTLVLVAIAGSLALEEKLYIGSVIGAALIVGALYMVLWGKGKEMKIRTQLLPSQVPQESGAVDMSQLVHDKSDFNSTKFATINRDSTKISEEETVPTTPKTFGA